MQDTLEIRFRGLQPMEELIRSARSWGARIGNGARHSRVEAQVLVDRCSPQWGGSTTVRVDFTVDGRQITEFANSEDPREALEESFTAVAKRLCFTDANRVPPVA